MHNSQITLIYHSIYIYNFKIFMEHFSWITIYARRYRELSYLNNKTEEEVGVVKVA